MSATTATVKSRSEKLESEALVGLSIEEIREQFADVLNIPNRASASVDGEIVEESYEVTAGDTVKFSLAVGEKG